ncbi:MAG TPA: DMT family transporter, partial [Steroidobacteraceae bacterium]
ALATLSLAVIGTALPFVLWFELLRRAPLTQLNGFSFLTPVFGLLIGALWFDERTSRLQIGGIALCLIGIYLLSRPPHAASPVRSGT